MATAIPITVWHHLVDTAARDVGAISLFAKLAISSPCRRFGFGTHSAFVTCPIARAPRFWSGRFSGASPRVGAPF